VRPTIRKPGTGALNASTAKKPETRDRRQRRHEAVREIIRRRRERFDLSASMLYLHR
jgi:hypothetical protein